MTFRTAGIWRRAALVLGLYLVQAHAIDMYKSDGRFYEGEPRPSTEVAIILSGGFRNITSGLCPSIESLAEEGKPVKALFFGKELAEVLPGRYKMKLGCGHVGSASSTHYQLPDVAIDAQPGHLYYIRAEKDTGPRTDRVAVDDFPVGDTYETLKDGEHVRKYVEGYLRGKRHQVKATDYGKPGVSWN
jgi:hypothetical protein